MMFSKEWQHRQLHSSPETTVEWRPLSQPLSNELTIGVKKDGNWVVDTGDGLVELNATGWFVPLFPCLEHPFRDIKAKLDHDLKHCEIPPSSVSSFPFFFLVLSALQAKFYWAEKAFSWLNEIKLDKEDFIPIIQALNAITQDRSQSQSSRHKAKDFLYEFEKKLSNPENWESNNKIPRST